MRNIKNFKSYITENHDYKELDFYDHILHGYETNEVSPEDVARQLDWSEIEKSKQRIAYITYHGTVDGIDIWHCYGSDDYYFSDAE